MLKHNLETRLQEFITGTETSTGITAVAVSGSRRYVALAEAGAAGVVGVYNLRRLYRTKTLDCEEVASNEFVSLSFSPNDALLVGLSGKPDWQVVVWRLDTGAVVGRVQASPMDTMSMYSISFNPLNNTKAAACGNGIFKFFTVDDSKVSVIPHTTAFNEREAADYTSMTWLDGETSLVGTSAGEILLFSKEEFSHVLPESPADGAPITAMTAFSDGFVIGQANGWLRVFEQVPSEGEGWFPRRNVRVRRAEHEEGNMITHLALSPTEEWLGVALASNQLVRLNFAQTRVKEDSALITDLATSSHGPAHGKFIAPGVAPVEGCPILGLDVCIRKPLVVTTGVDNTVRVWNYADKRQELCRAFADTALSVAFHPSGLHLLLGFSDKLRYCNILLDDLRVAKELNIKNCREARFTRGGSVFAAANGRTVQLFSSYTCELLCTLRGHGGLVTSIQFSPDDLTVLTAGEDGRLYQYSAQDGSRKHDIVHKEVAYSCAALSKDSKVVYAVGSNSVLTEVDVSKGNATTLAPSDVVLGAVATSSVGNFLFAGSSASQRVGNVFSYMQPLAQEGAERMSYPAASGPITRMALSHDATHLFAAGADGALLVFEVRDKDGRMPLRDAGARIPWSDEILVTRSDLEDMAAAIAELEEAQEELRSNNEYALRMREIAFQEDMKKVTERYTSELEQERQQFDLLAEEKVDLEREFGERIAAMEVAHRSECQKREGMYQEQIMDEVERYQQLEAECRAATEAHREKRAHILSTHASTLEEVRAALEKELSEARERRMELQRTKEGTQQDWSETKKQMQEDLDEETEAMRRMYEEKLTAQHNLILRCKSEHGIMSKKFATLKGDIEKQEEELLSLEENMKALSLRTASFDKEIEVLASMTAEKEAHITEKERQIYELKKRNQELEKFKFVLDFKIRELKRQIEPRESEIAAMREQIKQVDGELEAFHKSNAELDGMIGALRKQLEELQGGLSQQRAVNTRMQTQLNDFHSDLQAVSTHILDEAALKREFSALYRKYVPHGMSLKVADAAIVSEFDRQKDYLGKSVSALKSKVSKDSLANRAENVRIMQENMSLIKEIAELRQEVAQLRLQKKARALDAGATTGRPGTAASRHSSRGGRRSSGATTPAGPTMTRAEAEATLAKNKASIGILRVEITRLQGALAGVGCTAATGAGLP